MEGGVEEADGDWEACHGPGRGWWWCRSDDVWEREHNQWPWAVTLHVDCETLMMVWFMYHKFQSLAINGQQASIVMHGVCAGGCGMRDNERWTSDSDH